MFPTDITKKTYKIVLSNQSLRNVSMGIYATHRLVTLRVTAGLGDLGDKNIDAFADVQPGVMGEFTGDFTAGDLVLLFVAAALPGVLVLPRAILKQVTIRLVSTQCAVAIWGVNNYPSSINCINRIYFLN